jgi:hypothetical protein
MAKTNLPLVRVEGAQGPQGPQGAYGGPQGPQGNQGEYGGPQGNQGNQGYGAQGNQGPQGRPGSGGGGTGVSATGILSVSTFDINIVDPTRFDLGPITGIVVDNYTDPSNPVLTPVSYPGATSILDPLIASTDTSYLTMDSAGVLHFSDEEISEDLRRDRIRIGWLDHTGRTEIETVYFEPDPVFDIPLQFMDYMEAVGAFNFEEPIYQCSGARAESLTMELISLQIIKILM